MLDDLKQNKKEKGKLTHKKNQRGSSCECMQ